MARMIPSFVDDATPPGERDVFALLADGPDDWVVFHSLDLAPFNRNRRTEVDFVVVVPDVGVVCLEVKSHEDIYFDGDRWWPPSIHRSPFKQAADGSHSFYRGIKRLAPDLSYVPVVHCCIFPRSPFDLPPNLAVQLYELIEEREFSSFRTGRDFCQALKYRMLAAIAADQRLSSMRFPLHDEQLDRITSCCLPIQRRHPGSREQIERRQRNAEEMLRQQQKPVLRLASRNRSIVVAGPAGTGKTRIAMELARRQAEGGKRVALLCFNQLVGDWMTHQMERLSSPLPNLVVGRAIRELANMCDLDFPSSPSAEFWSAELPSAISERLNELDLQRQIQFDYLVVDEAQDILGREWLWTALFKCLVGGVRGGAFAFFGDFGHQVLGSREGVSRALDTLQRESAAAKWGLSENCRNYRIVGDTAVRLAGFGPDVYEGYMRAGGSVHNYDIDFYHNSDEQLDKLQRWLERDISAGYKPSEISVLSFCAEHASVAARLRATRYPLSPVWRGGDQVSYTSVHAFKGLENKVIVLTDVCLGTEEFHRDLFYTGMTRATESARILCDMRSRDTLRKWLAQAGDP